MQEYLLIGTVLKPQGVRGECKIKSYASDPESFHRWESLYRASGSEWEPVSFHLVRIHDGFIYAVLDACADANAAERFRGCDLYIHRKDASGAGKNGNLIADLVGCRAVDENGQTVGTLTDVLQHGPVDTWVFRTPSGTMMAPALLAVFPSVDPEAGVIRVLSEKLAEVSVFED